MKEMVPLSFAEYARRTIPLKHQVRQHSDKFYDGQYVIFTIGEHKYRCIFRGYDGKNPHKDCYLDFIKEGYQHLFMDLRGVQAM